MRFQETLVVIEREEVKRFTGIVDQNGNPIMAREVRGPIGFYTLGEADEKQDPVRP